MRSEGFPSEKKENNRFATRIFDSLYKFSRCVLDMSDFLAWTGSETFNDEVRAKIESYGFREMQKKEFEKGVREVIRRRMVVKDASKETGEKLFERVFGAPPEGRVELIPDTDSIIFQVETNKDMVAAATLIHLKPDMRDMPPPDEKDRSMRGVFIVGDELKEFTGCVIVINKKAIEEVLEKNEAEAKETGGTTEEIIKHEKQHAFDSLFYYAGARQIDFKRNDELFSRFIEAAREEFEFIGRLGLSIASKERKPTAADIERLKSIRKKMIEALRAIIAFALSIRELKAKEELIAYGVNNLSKEKFMAIMEDNYSPLLIIEIFLANRSLELVFSIDADANKQIGDKEAWEEIKASLKSEREKFKEEVSTGIDAINKARERELWPNIIPWFLSQPIGYWGQAVNEFAKRQESAA